MNGNVLAYGSGGWEFKNEGASIWQGAFLLHDSIPVVQKGERERGERNTAQDSLALSNPLPRQETSLAMIDLSMVLESSQPTHLLRDSQLIL